MSFSSFQMTSTVEVMRVRHSVHLSVFQMVLSYGMMWVSNGPYLSEFHTVSSSARTRLSYPVDM